MQKLMIQEIYHFDMRTVNTYSLPGIMAEPHYHIICNVFGTTVEELNKKKRDREVVDAKFTAIYFDRTIRKFTCAASAGVWGMDHSSAVHAVKKVNDFLKYDKEYKKLYNEAIKRINNDPLCLMILRKN